MHIALIKWRRSSSADENKLYSFLAIVELTNDKLCLVLNRRVKKNSIKKWRCFKVNKHIQIVSN